MKATKIIRPPVVLTPDRAPESIPEPIVRKQRRKPERYQYARTVLEVPSALANWYWLNGTAAFEMWQKNDDGNLMRGKRRVALRRKLILDLCILPEMEKRISPGDIARFVNVNHSILFTIANAMRSDSPTQTSNQQEAA